MDVGDGVTQIAPIIEGYTVKNAIQRADLAGRDVTEYLMLLLKRQGYLGLHTSAEFEIVKDIKERFCFVNTSPLSNDQSAIVSTDQGKPYTLPDGSEIKLLNERKEAPEILFNPGKIGLEYQGLPDLLIHSIMNCDIDLRLKLFDNIILAGGTTVFTTFTQRFHKDLQTRLEQRKAKNFKMRVIAPANRLYSCWIGGSTLAALQSFNTMWITKEEYKQNGSKILFLKNL